MKLKIVIALFVAICAICLMMAIAIAFNNLKVVGVLLVVVVILNAIINILNLQ